MKLKIQTIAALIFSGLFIASCGGSSSSSSTSPSGASGGAPTGSLTFSGASASQLPSGTTFTPDTAEFTQTSGIIIANFSMPYSNPDGTTSTAQISYQSQSGTGLQQVTVALGNFSGQPIPVFVGGVTVFDPYTISGLSVSSSTTAATLNFSNVVVSGLFGNGPTSTGTQADITINGTITTTQ